MLERRAEIRPYWDKPAPEDEEHAHQLEHFREEDLLSDALPPAETNAIALTAMTSTGLGFWLAAGGTGLLVAALLGTWGIQIFSGLGITGLNRSVMWGPYIANLVFFIGIGHAGTFISAALRLMHMDFRRPISRAAETVTLFGLSAAALFPLIHVGRIWKIYYMFPIPDERRLWPNFRSPLLWDATAITTYLLGSTLFMYAALIPDLAMARDHTIGWRHQLYAALSLGWRGSLGEWMRLEKLSNILGYVIIPVMFSVHTIVSYDFAMAVQPGWHSTIFGPFFIAGALFSGVAAVIMVLIIIRKSMHLGYFLREQHFNSLGIFLMLLSIIWGYFYFNEWIVTWYGNLTAEQAILNMLTGQLSPLFYLMLVCNLVIPLGGLWSRRVRTSLPAMFVICVAVQIGMYLERILIVPGFLSRSELPFNWVNYTPHLPEILITIGTFGLLSFLYILWTRIVPIIPVWEVHEGQAFQSTRRVGRSLFTTHTDMH